MRIVIAIVILLAGTKGWSTNQNNRLIEQKQQQIRQKKQQIKNFKQNIRNFEKEENQLQTANSRFVNQRLLLHEMFKISKINGDSFDGLVLFVADQRFDYEDIGRRLIESGDYADKKISQQQIKFLIAEHFLELDELQNEATQDEIKKFIDYSLKVQKEIAKEIANTQYFISLNIQDQQALMKKTQRQIVKIQKDIEAIKLKIKRNRNQHQQHIPYWWPGRGLLIP